MIELTTGVVFLMSSLYGAGTNQGPIQNATDTAPIQQATSSATTAARSFTDSKIVEAYVRKEFSGTPILVEVARCESTFRQYDSNGDVVRGKVDSADVGVMQINEKYHADEAAKLGYDIYSTEGNVAFAKYLYAKEGTQPWMSSSPCWSGSLAMK